MHSMYYENLDLLQMIPAKIFSNSVNTTGIRFIAVYTNAKSDYDKSRLKIIKYCLQKGR